MIWIALIAALLNLLPVLLKLIQGSWAMQGREPPPKARARLGTLRSLCRMVDEGLGQQGVEPDPEGARQAMGEHDEPDGGPKYAV